MDWTATAAQAAQALASAPPHALVETLQDVLQQEGPGLRCVLYLADLRLDSLRPVTPREAGGPDTPGDGVSFRIDDTDHGRSFAAQRVMCPRAEAGLLLIPVSVRGDRLGVLEVRAGAGSDADPEATEAVETAARLGAVLGQALLAADLVTDVYRVARREQALTLSAEAQWELLPGRSLDAGYATVAGQLEPAYSVVGDVYDWAAGPGGLWAALIDGGGGAGPQASQTVSLAVAALRNARRGGADLAGAARLADQALQAQPRGDSLASAVLLALHPDTATLEVVVAGAGTIVVAGRHGVRTLDIDRDPPLGAEEDYPYRAHVVQVASGDRVVAVSDGLSDAQVSGRVFGAGLGALVQGFRLLGAAEVVRAVIRELRTFHDGAHLQDDAVVICLDVTARHG